MNNPLLKLGDRGEAVSEAQTLLKKHGYLRHIDGIFGKGTKNAIMDFQRANDEVSDGIIGERTWSALKRTEKFVWRLKEKDYEWAAEQLDCDINAIKAVSEVESAGDGFIEAGKPKILFERHWMYRKLKECELPTLVAIASKELPNIVNTKSGGYKGGNSEHRRFDEAYGLNHNAAIEATSWGRFQILGMHYSRLGYSSPSKFKNSMEKDEGEHLKAFVRFIKTDTKLLKAIQCMDWRSFAYYYNGPQHKSYDKKMQRAYERLSS